MILVKTVALGKRGKLSCEFVGYGTPSRCNWWTVGCLSRRCRVGSNLLLLLFRGRDDIHMLILHVVHNFFRCIILLFALFVNIFKVFDWAFRFRFINPFNTLL